MAELSAEDFEAFIGADSDEKVQQMLDAALAAARGYCGWHVSPVRTGHTPTVDGPAGTLLDLPTRKLLTVNSVTEDGADVDVATLDWSENGSVRKQSGACWSARYRSIVVDIDHGFTEIEAADWRQAIMAMVAVMSRTLTGESGSGPLVRKRVDDVEYQWSDQQVADAAASAVYSAIPVLDRYRVRSVLFA